MGWRERDYARWTDDERSRYVGSRVETNPSSAGGLSSSGYWSAGAPERRRRRRRRLLARIGVAVAIVAATAATAGQLPRADPLLPALHFDLPRLHGTTHAPGVAKLQLPRHAPVGSTLTLSSAHDAGTGGRVRISGTYTGRWHTITLVPLTDTGYRARIWLRRRGLLHLRIVYPDGTRSVGSIRVR